MIQAWQQWQPSFKMNAGGAPPSRQPAFYFRMLPADYFAKAGSALPSIGEIISKYPVKTGTATSIGDASENNVVDNAFGTFLKQCSSIEMRLYASASDLTFHITVAPTEKSKLQNSLTPLKGNISKDTLDEIVSETIGNPSFRLSERLDSAIRFIFSSLRHQSDADLMIETLPQFDLSVNCSRLMLCLKLSPEALRSALLRTGAIQEEKPAASPAAGAN
jgi:hypothetical protein